jgi:hypothetical protein
VLRALLDAWQEDRRYRISRVKSRMKFMMDDHGPEGIRALVEERIGRRLADYELAPVTVLGDHIGVHAQSQPGLSYIGVPVHLGLMSGDQMLAVADLAESVGGDVRLTRQQNFVVTNVPESRVDEAVGTLAEIGFPLDVNRVRATSLACTGEPHCNFAVTETKTRLDSLVRHLEARFGAEIENLKLTSTAARTPAPTTGSATSASRAPPCATSAASGGRPTTSSCAAASARILRSRGRCSARADRGARRHRRPSRRGLAGRPPPGRGVPRVLRPDERRRAWDPGRPRAGASARGEGGRMSAIELIDELEAGELSVEFEGQEPQELLEWALERFSPRIALSTAFQIDGVALSTWLTSSTRRSRSSASTPAACPRRHSS